MIGLLSFVVAVGMVAYLRRGSFVDKAGDPNASGIIKTVVMALLIGAVAGKLGGAVTIIGAGERGVIFDNIYGVKPKALSEGVNFITPFLQDVIVFDVRTQKVEFEATAASKDLQNVATKVALNFNPAAEAVPEIYQTYGVNYEEKIIHPAVQEAVKAITALYTAEELITKRETVKAGVQDHLAKMMSTAHLQLTQTYITDFKFEQAFSQAIEQKQVAEQQAMKAKRDLDRVKLEAEQKIAGLRAEAEGLRMQKEQITPQLIELRRIEKWDGHYPQIMGGSTMSLMNLDKAIGQK
jgi:regulator of protease activity HflC (stomatin/prohibitin superfamily)